MAIFLAFMVAVEPTEKDRLCSDGALCSNTLTGESMAGFLDHRPEVPLPDYGAWGHKP